MIADEEHQMKRSSVLLCATLMILATLPMMQGRAQTQAPAAAPAGATQDPAGRGRGRGQQTPPPPPLTCTSKATETDNKVPAALAKDGFTAIFNGNDLTGWQALIDIGTLKFGAGLNPADLLTLSPAERAARQKESNETYLKHWSVVDGILVFDGVQADKLTPHVEKGGQNLQSVKEYGDVDLYVDWCIEAGADSGVYLKNAPQIQIWTSPLGSGGLFNNKAGARNPLVVADNPADRWNTFHIIQRGGDMTTVWLNGQLVVDNVKMENYWDYSKPLPAKGNIELQYHGHKLYWKNIYVKELN
jgi:3-keto-disaccharide hydrolase